MGRATGGRGIGGLCGSGSGERASGVSAGGEDTKVVGTGGVRVGLIVDLKVRRGGVTVAVKAVGAAAAVGAVAGAEVAVEATVEVEAEATVDPLVLRCTCSSAVIMCLMRAKRTASVEAVDESEEEDSFPSFPPAAAAGIAGIGGSRSGSGVSAAAGAAALPSSPCRNVCSYQSKRDVN